MSFASRSNTDTTDTTTFAVITTNTQSIPILVYVPDEDVHVLTGRDEILVPCEQDYVDGLAVIAKDRKWPLMPNIKHTHSAGESPSQHPLPVLPSTGNQLGIASIG